MEDVKSGLSKTAMSTRYTADPAFAAKTKAFLEDIKKKPEPNPEPPVKATTKGASRRASLKKDEPPTPKLPPSVSVKDLANDIYCWHCHKFDAPIPCKVCPRSFHCDCLGPSGNPDGILDECSECKAAKEPWTGSGHFSMYVAYIIKNMLIAESIQFFINSRPEDFEFYEDYIINKVDIHQITKNNEMKRYSNSKALIGDVKWILHNAVVYFGASHSLSIAAKNLLKVCQINIQDLERCQQCFQRAHAGIKDWFIRVCDKPHPIVLAKVRGFPFWPSKVLHFDSNNAECWFFGPHDKASVPLHNLHLLPKDVQIPGKKRQALQKAIDEMSTYITNYEKKFGPIEYFPPQTVPTLEQLQGLFACKDAIAETPPSLLEQVPGAQTTVDNQREHSASPPSLSVDPGSPQHHDTEDFPFSSSLKNTPLRSKKRTPESGSPMSPAKKKIKLMPLSKQKEDAIKRGENCLVKVEKIKDELTLPSSPIKTYSVKIKQEKISHSESFDRLETGGKTTSTITYSKKNIISSPIASFSSVNNNTNSLSLLATSKTKSPVSTTYVLQSPTKCFISSSSISTTSPQTQQHTPIKMTIRAAQPSTSTTSLLASGMPQILAAKKSPSITPIIVTGRSDKTPSSSRSGGANPPTIRVIETYRRPAPEMPKLQATTSLANAISLLVPSSTLAQPEEYIVAEKALPTPATSSHQEPKPKSNVADSNSKMESDPSSFNLQEMLLSTRTAQEESEQSSNKLLVKLMNQAKTEAELETNSSCHPPENDIIDLTEDDLPESLDMKEEVKRLRGLLKDCETRLRQQRSEYDKRIRDLRYNNQLNLLEMKTCCEMEKMRETAKIKIEFEELLQKRVEENKKKQWCAACGNEASFFCCWNTSYCNYECQSKHWDVHSGSCTQVTKQITTTAQPLDSALVSPQQKIAIPRFSKVINAVTSRSVQKIAPRLQTTGQPQVLFLVPQQPSTQS